jgi:putative flippase GtrA
MTTTLDRPVPVSPVGPRLLDSPVLRFLVVGGASTVGYLALYALLRLWLPAQLANVLALLATGDVNTVLNRRWSFGLQGTPPAGQRVRGVAAYLVGLVATSAALALLGAVGVDGTVAELTALGLANAVAGVVHYVLLRSWAFGLPRAAA